MRALLGSPLGFLIGFSLGALGGGGSILAVPTLVYGAGQDPKAATATSLILVGAASLIGMVGHWRAGRVHVGLGAIFGLVGVGGSIAGSAINRRLDPDALLLGFSALVVIAAWRMITACPTCTNVGEERALARHFDETKAQSNSESNAIDGATSTLRSRRAGSIVVAGTGVGFLTGLFGVGGGFVIVPALTLLLALPMPDAIGTSLLVITINSCIALTARLATTSTIEWQIAVPFTVAAVVGVLSGSSLANRLDPEVSLKWFAVGLIVVAIYTAARALQGIG